MNEVIRQLQERKSVRVFEEREIAAEEKQQILQAAVMAPTAGNQQLYTILDITDPNIKEQLAQTCDQQPFIAQAKLVLIFCADCQKWYEAFKAAGCTPRKPGAGDLLLAVSDANIAAQNAVTAAWSLGIGSCYIGDVMENCEYHRELLHLPPYVFPAAMVVFGYPTQHQLIRRKPERADLSFVVRENEYRKMEAEDYREMLEPRCQNKEYEAWMQAFCERKYNAAFAREMTRSTQQYLHAFGMEPVKEQTYSFFSHTNCPYFPCHKGVASEEFSCLFCYCPLYALGKDCGGNFTITANGYKNCTGCNIPHRKENYDKILSRYKDIAEMVKKNL